VSDPVRFGVLGCARVFERRMVPGFALAENAQLLAVASRSGEKARVTAEKHGIPKFYGSYETLLEDPDIEAVFIPLPNDAHAEWTRKALRAGKHVLCDKPLALTRADAEAGAALARESDLRLMEGFMYRFHPQHARVHEIVRSGAIGTPVRFEASFCYPSARDLTNIRYQKERAGGALLDVGVYGINAARWFLGEPDDVHVFSQTDPECGIDTASLISLKFASGGLASVACSFGEAFSSTYAVIGTEGRVTAERGFQVGESGVALRIRAHNADTETIETFPHLDQYALEIQHFAACIQNPEKPLEPGEDGVLQARVVERARG
jgi:D-xylose 1-dehydrogenase (NADP+, D-xylono-1,5-lactone-forming)